MDRSGVFLEPGEHEVMITADGFKPWSERIVLDGGAPVRVVVNLQPEPHVEPEPAIPSWAIYGSAS